MKHVWIGSVREVENPRVRIYFFTVGVYSTDMHAKRAIEKELPVGFIEKHSLLWHEEYREYLQEGNAPGTYGKVIKWVLRAKGSSLHYATVGRWEFNK